jgi:hypothetical protein
VILLLNRLHVPLDRDVIYVAEANEEGTNTASGLGIDYLIREHWPDIEAEYVLAEGGRVHTARYNGLVNSKNRPRFRITSLITILGSTPSYGPPSHQRFSAPDSYKM